MYLIKMAWRNIKRNKRRSTLAIISVALSMGLVLFLNGMVIGLTRSVVKNSTKNETGHVLITTKGFADKKRFMLVNEYIKKPEKLEKLLMRDPVLKKDIVDFNERIVFGILLQYEGRNKPVIAMAGDPAKETNYLMLNRSVIEGKYLPLRMQDKHYILIGKKIADTLKIGTGDQTKVLIQGADYSPHIPTLTVRGIFKTGLNMMDNRVFQMDINDARRILGMGKGAQEIMVFLKDYKDADKVAGRIEAILSKSDFKQKFSVLPWTKAGGYASMILNMEAVYNFLYFIIALLGAVIITNIMTMVVMERRKEIGIIKSMGFNNREVMLLFFIEGVILGIIGSIAGVIIGYVASLYPMIKGIDFSSSLSNMNMPMESVIYVVFTAGGIISVMLIGIFTASLVSVFPARKAAKMNVVEAIKSV